MDHIRGVVERITYQNEENGYSVIKCRVKNYSDLVTVVGSMAEVHVGSVLYIGGSWRVDPKYGRQFSMETYEDTLPATVYGIEKYLVSGLVKGIGPKFASKIVQAFGKDTLDVIEENPDKLLSVPGIGKKRVDQVKKSWNEQKEIKNIMLFLQGHTLVPGTFEWYKAIAYGCLYKALTGDHVDDTKAGDVTMTLVRREKPEELLGTLIASGLEVSSNYPGIYHVRGNVLFETQVIATHELPAGTHVWLKALTRSIDALQPRRRNIRKGAKNACWQIR